MAVEPTFPALAEVQGLYQALDAAESHLQALLRRVWSLRAMTATEAGRIEADGRWSAWNATRGGAPSSAELAGRRRRLGLSQVALAKAAGMSRQGLTEIERDKRKSPHTRWLIHSVLLGLEQEREKGKTA